jgi:hypothetical protein
MYITINDIELGGKYLPFELFVNSKEMNHFQWIVALTRLISAVFRNGNSTYIAGELKSVFDPRGGYWEKGSYHNSLVAKIGAVIEAHLKAIGVIEDEAVPTQQKEIIEVKKAEFVARGNADDKMQVCPKCAQKTAILMDGCLTCVECGFSKCG